MKKTLFKIFTAISKQKWRYFIILSLILIYSSIQAIRYSDIPIWANMPEYFIKPQNADMLQYNLSVSYIVSYMFYMLVNFIPDLVESVEKQSETIPFKATIHKEIQQFTKGIIYLWATIGVNANSKGYFNISEIVEVDDFFKQDVIEEITKHVKLQESIKTYAALTLISEHYDWSLKMRLELDKICTLGNLILTRYKDNVPLEIFYDIFYIINESNMIGELLVQLNGINSLKNGKNLYLADCTNFNKNLNVGKSCQSIINLYNWVNIEYEYFSDNINDINITVNKIDIKYFFK
ncbi:hypothetical protein [Clostridium gasigenes]|uniref:Uncharacterized protein n=1 Tax=Clostridium gasigenes TaxID=94869 RepID=A0A1H0UM62_9CLOT|nr:hypothetical protein [Clostridium gasigenes]SDP67279.1 hypothetical protein SAMN04488529_11186 [Clostridium gasigenes]